MSSSASILCMRLSKGFRASTPLILTPPPAPPAQRHRPRQRNATSPAGATSAPRQPHATGPASVPPSGFFTHSIDVRAVAIRGDALYKDIRLSGNGVRALRAEADGEAARQGLGTKKRMLPHDRAQPAAQDKPSWPARIMQWVGRAPLIIKVLMVAAALVLWPFLLPFALLTSAIAVAQKRPGRAAAYATATWVLPVAIFAHVYRVWSIPLLILPFVIAWVTTTKKLASVYVPCRSTAWAMLWSIPAGFILLRVWPHQPTIGVVAAILIALAILGWRLAKVVQDERMYGRDGATQARRPGLGPAGPMPAGAPPASGRFPGVRGHPVAAPRPRPQISVEDAMAELDAMIGLTPVKEQVRSIAASIEAARRR